MSNLSHLIRALSGQPLAIEPGFLSAFKSVIARHLAGERFSGADLHAELGIAAGRGDRSPVRAAGIAVIPVVGVIAQRAHSLGTSTEEIGATIDAALASKAIDAILLEVDSPGGTVSGVPELAAKIRAADQVKPIMASVNSLAASAGYWLASQAREIIITPSGEAGSLGVFTIHENWSKNLEQEGVEVTPVSAGEFKLEGAPWAPLTEAAKEHLQASVDEAYTWFVRDVAMGRRDTQTNVRAGYGRGRVLGAADALKANLVDRVGTLDEAVARLANRVAAKQRSAVGVERERMSLDRFAARS